MTGVRKIEISLAALIAGTAVFAAFVPGASSSESEYARTDFDATYSNSFAAPIPRFDPAEFQDLQVSDAARAVAASVAGSRIDAQRFNAPAPTYRELRSAPVQVTPRASAESGPAWSGRTLGVSITAAPQNADGTTANWWFIGGAGQESYAVAPAGLREFTVAPVAAQTTVGDAHFGVGVRVNEGAYASVGYVREQRKYVLGAEDWEEDEHYFGVGFQARW